MKTTIEKSEGKVVVTLEGRLDSYVADEVGTQIETLYDLTDTEITLDCTKLDYITSNGLRVFFLILLVLPISLRLSSDFVPSD